MKTTQNVIIILVLTLLVKFLYLYRVNSQGGYTIEAAFNGADAGHYLTIGKNIADYKVFSDTNSIYPSEEATWRPPFWPFILSVLFHFTSNPLYLIVTKCILESCLILCFLFSFKRRIQVTLFGIMPFFLLLIEPSHLKYSLTFLSEGLTAILVLLLVYFFLFKELCKDFNFIVPSICACVILCHPVSIFFVLTLFVIYLLCNVKSNFYMVLSNGLLFSVLVLAWPARNHFTFHKGFYITASQGSTFSKGWNERVSCDFNNVQGDLADESLNLKYLDNLEPITTGLGPLELSKLYTEATKKYITSISLQEKINIILIKLKSNFNPFPEKPKRGFFEYTSIIFRLLYFFSFLQLIYRVFKKPKFNYDSLKDRIYMVIASILLGQIIMSTLVYTGLRFNAIYSLAMLFCFILLNVNFIQNKIFKSKDILYLK